MRMDELWLPGSCRNQWGPLWCGTVEVVQYSITYEFVSTHNLYTWYLTGAYAPHTMNEKLICWEERTVVKSNCDSPWVICRDFNTRTIENGVTEPLLLCLNSPIGYMRWNYMTIISSVATWWSFHVIRKPQSPKCS